MTKTATPWGTMLRASKAGWKLNSDTTWSRRKKIEEVVPEGALRIGRHIVARSSVAALDLDHQIDTLSRIRRAQERKSPSL